METDGRGGDRGTGTETTQTEEIPKQGRESWIQRIKIDIKRFSGFAKPSYPTHKLTQPQIQIQRKQDEKWNGFIIRVETATTDILFNLLLSSSHFLYK